MTRLHWSLSHPHINYINYYWIHAECGRQLSGFDMYFQRVTIQKMQQQQRTKAKILQQAETPAPGIPLLL